MKEPQFIRAVNRVHLVYLGVLPSLATFVMLRRYGYRWPFLLFIGGVAMMGVYLASVYHYTHLPSSVLVSVWVLLDGPLFALAAQGFRNFNLSFVIEGFLIDGLALWLAILLLAIVSPLPSLGQRAASLSIGLGVMGVMLSLFWPYVSRVWGDWFWLIWLVSGIGEGAIARYRLLQSGAAARLEDDKSILYVASLVMLWVVVMNVSIALYDGQ